MADLLPLAEVEEGVRHELLPALLRLPLALVAVAALTDSPLADDDDAALLEALPPRFALLGNRPPQSFALLEWRRSSNLSSAELLPEEEEAEELLFPPLPPPLALLALLARASWRRCAATPASSSGSAENRRAMIARGVGTLDRVCEVGRWSVDCRARGLFNAAVQFGLPYAMRWASSPSAVATRHNEASSLARRLPGERVQ